MNDFKFEIKKRTELTKYLENVFANDAAESFLKSHKKNIYSKNLLMNDRIKYSSYFTRVWLNYLDNEQLGKIFSKKLKTK